MTLVDERKLLEKGAQSGTLQSDVDFEPPNLAETSTRFGEAVSVQLMTSVEALVYDPWTDGLLVRGLSYSADCGWERDVGAPEAWEAPFRAAGGGLMEHVTAQVLVFAIQKHLGLPSV